MRSPLPVWARSELRHPSALVGFVVLVLAWPLPSVGGTALAAELAPGEKGEALGLFNASSSLAGVVGAFLGGWGMAKAGYGTICAVSAVVVAVAPLCSSRVVARPAQVDSPRRWRSVFDPCDASSVTPDGTQDS